MTSPRAPTTPIDGSSAPAGSAPRPGPGEAIERLRTSAKELLRLSLTEHHLQAFSWYLEELIQWNTRQNLTAVVDPIEICLKHFLDSLTLVPRLGAFSGGRMVDVGTGAGFPGLPVRIVCPALRLTLVEATGRKAAFCRHVVEGLGLRQVTVLHARAEEIGRHPDHRQAYDVAVARAVATLPVLLEYLLPLVRVGGRVLAQKGEHGPAEAQQSSKALELLGARLLRLHAIELPGVAEPRYIVEIEKAAATPEVYPRRPGAAAKRPLLE
jgi:16S rRNA (guanine527-N7)-methyltransferase